MLFAFTIFHTILSLIALVLGVPAIRTLRGAPLSPRWTVWFLGFAVATTLTGFFFPFHGMTPAIAVGIVSCVVLGLVYFAQYKFWQAGAWAKIYAAGIVASEFFLVFVTVAQAFQKIPPLHALAPTGSEPAFGLTEGVALIVFAYLGYKSVRRAV